MVPCFATGKGLPVANEVGEAAEDELGIGILTTDELPKDIGYFSWK